MKENESRLTKRLQEGKALCIAECEKECTEGYYECHKCKPFADVLVKLAEYEDIGTVEEFKALKENQFFNFDSPVVRIDKKSYDKAIDDLCNEFHKDWEEQSENDMEDCINWYDWLIACAEQLKGEKQ